MVVTIPLPPKEVKPNGRYHWRQRASKVAEYRLEAKEAAMAAAFQQDQRRVILRPIVQVRYYNRTRAKMDPDNAIASLKAAFDGFTDAGIWTDDREVTFLPVRHSKDPDDPRVEVTIVEGDRPIAEIMLSV